MAGFLQGLSNLLLGYDHPASGGVGVGGIVGPGPVADSAGDDDPLRMSVTPTAMQGAPTMAHEQGLLGKLGKWAISPEGRLAIGTTLRAGTGDENAFRDQQNILNSNALLQQKAQARSDAQEFQKAFVDSMETDPATGAQKFNKAAFAKRVSALKGAVDPKDVVDLMNSMGPKTVPVGKHIASIDQSSGDVSWLADAPLDEEDIADREDRRALNEERRSLYRAQAAALPQDVETRAYRAHHPGTGRPPAAAPDLSHATDDEIDAYIARKTGGQH